MSTQITISPEIKLVVNTTPITGGSAGQILFQTTGNTVGESANLSWDNTNARLRVNGAVIAGNGLCSLTNGPGNYGQVGSNYYYDGTTPRRWGNDHAAQIDFGLGFKFRVAGNGASGSAISWSELGYWNASTGNLLVGTTTDAGFRLDVNGDTILRRVTFITPNTITGGTEFFRVQSGNGFTPLIRGYENGVLGLGSSSGSIGFGTANFNFITGSNFDFNYVPLNQLNTFALRLTANYTNVGAGGTSQGTMFRTVGSTSTSVGNVTMNQIEMTPAYNNTGGVTTNRGIYYNPTLTSMTNTTHFAFHSTSGRVRFEGLPTSSAGLSAGDIWNDGGTLKIV